ncbi:MAG: serine/threonine-protein kinase, partial [Deltaproteobacteria bacterium]
MSTVPSPRRSLGRYEILAPIASGGMGSVVLARRQGAGGFQRLFAIKVPLRWDADDEYAHRMVLDEARIAARIHHPNVVSIHEVDETPGGGWFLVMDYVEGAALSSLLPRLDTTGREHYRFVLRILLDALEGLHAAHNLVDDDGKPLEVVHRDISPQNLLVGADGVTRVTDFGIAKAVERLARTRIGSVKGKLGYMAPEQASGGYVDFRTDLFAMGIVLWESLTRRRLFRAANDEDVRAMVISAAVPRASTYAHDLPDAIDAVCQRALQREPFARYGSARAMAEALEAAAET